MKRCHLSITSLFLQSIIQTDQVKQSGSASSDHFKQRRLPLPKSIHKKKQPSRLRLKITITTCSVSRPYQTKCKSGGQEWTGKNPRIRQTNFGTVRHTWNERRDDEEGRGESGPSVGKEGRKRGKEIPVGRRDAAAIPVQQRERRQVAD